MSLTPKKIKEDIDGREGVHIDVVHAKSHLTLGDIEGCRIPVSAPVTPRWFVEFILRNFYQTQALDFISGLPNHKINFSTSITTNEINLMHMIIPYEPRA